MAQPPNNIQVNLTVTGALEGETKRFNPADTFMCGPCEDNAMPHSVKSPRHVERCPNFIAATIKQGMVKKTLQDLRNDRNYACLLSKALPAVTTPSVEVAEAVKVLGITLLSNYVKGTAATRLAVENLLRPGYNQYMRCLGLPVYMAPGTEVQLPVLQPGVLSTPLVAAYGPDNSAPYMPAAHSPQYPQSVYTNVTPDALNVPGMGGPQGAAPAFAGAGGQANGGAGIGGGAGVAPPVIPPPVIPPPVIPPPVIPPPVIPPPVVPPPVVPPPVIPPPVVPPPVIPPPVVPPPFVPPPLVPPPRRGARRAAPGQPAARPRRRRRNEAQLL
jgi:hypothetical protein